LKFVLHDKERDKKAIEILWSNLRAFWFSMLAVYVVIAAVLLFPKISNWLYNEGFTMIKTPIGWYEYPFSFITFLILSVCPAFLFFSGLGFAFYLIRYKSGLYSESKSESTKEGKPEPKE
jgi:hypothetical protein